MANKAWLCSACGIHLGIQGQLKLELTIFNSLVAHSDAHKYQFSYLAADDL